jgi:hypothetical protein
MSGPAVGDLFAVPLDDVLVAEPCSANIDAACMDPQPVVEPRRLQVTDVCLDRHRLDSLVPK